MILINSLIIVVNFPGPELCMYVWCVDLFISDLLFISLYLFMCRLYIHFCWQQIDPCSYCRVFGEALDGDMLSGILKMLNKFYIRFVI